MGAYALIIYVLLSSCSFILISFATGAKSLLIIIFVSDLNYFFADANNEIDEFFG
jgi:hypothetical protein